MKEFEHAPELNEDSPAYDAVIRELDKVVYDHPDDVAEGLTLKNAFISTESLLADFISCALPKEMQESKLRRLSESLHLELRFKTPIWKIVKDYESLMKVN